MLNHVGGQQKMHAEDIERREERQRQRRDTRVEVARILCLDGRLAAIPAQPRRADGPGIGDSGQRHRNQRYRLEIPREPERQCAEYHRVPILPNYLANAQYASFAAQFWSPSPRRRGAGGEVSGWRQTSPGLRPPSPTRGGTRPPIRQSATCVLPSPRRRGAGG